MYIIVKIINNLLMEGHNHKFVHINKVSQNEKLNTNWKKSSNIPLQKKMIAIEIIPPSCLPHNN